MKKLLSNIKQTLKNKVNKPYEPKNLSHLADPHMNLEQRGH